MQGAPNPRFPIPRSQFGTRCGGWRATLLSGNPKLTQALGLKAQRVRAVQNGAIACELLHYEL